jgi:hypothetical protein
MPTVQRALADVFRAQAAWRERKAAERPDDLRNYWAAKRLTALAELVTSLPDDDPVIVALGTFAGGQLDEAAKHRVSQFGFHRREDPRRFLARLAAVAGHKRDSD